MVPLARIIRPDVRKADASAKTQTRNPSAPMVLPTMIESRRSGLDTRAFRAPPCRSPAMDRNPTAIPRIAP